MRYLENRLGTPQQRLGRSAASCVQESADLWNRSAPAAGTNLDQLLADTALGPAYQCRKLLNEVAEELNEKPPSNQSVLRRELAGLRKSVQASAWDDLLGFARRVLVS